MSEIKWPEIYTPQNKKSIEEHVAATNLQQLTTTLKIYSEAFDAGKAHRLDGVSLSQLAKKYGLTKEGIRYRINQVENILIGSDA